MTKPRQTLTVIGPQGSEVTVLYTDIRRSTRRTDE